jgi:hypothetical protein
MESLGGYMTIESTPDRGGQFMLITPKPSSVENHSVQRTSLRFLMEQESSEKAAPKRPVHS